MYVFGDWMMFYGILTSIAALFIFCVIFRNYKHIKTAIQVIDAAADFVIEHKRLMIVPLTYFIVNLSFVFICVYNVGLIISTNDI